jgi:hypothetical protein
VDNHQWTLLAFGQCTTGHAFCVILPAESGHSPPYEKNLRTEDLCDLSEAGGPSDRPEFCALQRSTIGEKGTRFSGLIAIQNLFHYRPTTGQNLFALGMRFPLLLLP